MRTRKELNVAINVVAKAMARTNLTNNQKVTLCGMMTCLSWMAGHSYSTIVEDFLAGKPVPGFCDGKHDEEVVAHFDRQMQRCRDEDVERLLKEVDDA